MNKNIIILLALIGLIGLFSNCEKDGTQVTMLESPNVPTIKTMPDLTLLRAEGADTLTFIGTPVDPGFNASATYFLEACVTGNEFEDAILIYTGVQVDSIQITNAELNGILLKAFPEDATSSVDFRIRAILVVDGGTGAPGTGSDLMEYNSVTTTENATIYGLLRLDLIGSGVDQKITSPLSDGKYNGLVKLDPAQAFTLLDPETSASYGGTGDVLAVDGAGIVITDVTGWYDFNADIIDLNYAANPYFIGLVGDATPNGWDAPDSKMEYNPASGNWSITIDLIDGYIKFRKNDGWAWNMGLADGGADGELQQGGVGNDIPVTAGNYTVIFTILSDDAGTYELITN